MNYDYDLTAIKEALTIEDVEMILVEFGAEPVRKNETIVSRTVCHGGDSNKLYYYQNSHLFHCYTGCSDPTFDIFELTRKVMSKSNPKPREDSEWNLPEAVDYIARKFGYSPNVAEDVNKLDIEKDLIILNNYDRIKNIDISTQQIELKEYDGYFLKNLPRPHILGWEAEGISKSIMDNHNICFDPLNNGIVIPHYDINNRLIGIRERTLIKEQAEKYGKYMPARIAGTMYNHPLSYNLYNLNNSKDNIKTLKKAIVFEGEKSTLQYSSFFGEQNDISVASCGSAFIAYQAWLLIQQGAEEIIIGYDKQFQKIGDKEFQKLIKNLKNIHKRFGQYVQISFLFDKKDLLGYKDSPTDRGADVFLELFKERVNLYA